MGRKGMEQKRELPPNCPYTSCLRWRGQSDARNTMASSTVPRICPTQRASSISTVTCPVKALVEATPISGPTWMYVPVRISWDRGTHDVADAIHKSPLAPCQLYGGNGSERSYFLCNSIHFSKEKSDASKRGWIRWAHSFSSPLTMWMFISWQFRQIALLQLIYR